MSDDLQEVLCYCRHAFNDGGSGPRKRREKLFLPALEQRQVQQAYQRQVCRYRHRNPKEPSEPFKHGTLPKPILGSVKTKSCNQVRMLKRLPRFSIFLLYHCNFPSTLAQCCRVSACRIRNEILVFTESFRICRNLEFSYDGHFNKNY